MIENLLHLIRNLHKTQQFYQSQQTQHQAWQRYVLVLPMGEPECAYILYEGRKDALFLPNQNIFLIQQQQPIIIKVETHILSLTGGWAGRPVRARTLATSRGGCRICGMASVSGSRGTVVSRRSRSVVRPAKFAGTTTRHPEPSPFAPPFDNLQHCAKKTPTVTFFYNRFKV